MWIALVFAGFFVLDIALVVLATARGRAAHDEPRRNVGSLSRRRP